ncbi:MAG: hypothetical protein ACI3Z9_03390 [Candidatus Onthomorpha sp.]
MKKIFVFAAALIFAGAVSMAQEPVKKSQEPQKTEKTCCSKDKKAEHKCSGDCKNHQKATTQKADKACCSKDKKTEAHKCSGNCKNHQKDATKKCSGDCKNHQKELKK